MKIIVIIAVVAILAAFGISRVIYSRSQKGTPPQSTPKDTYEGLRNVALQSSRSQLGLPAPSTQTQAWGVIMDWGLPNGTATIVAFSDGNASVYLSSGGGYIGGSTYDSVRKAAQKMVALAATDQAQMHPATTFPLPAVGQVNFYVRTDSGVFSASASQEELSGHRHPLSQLGDAGQDIISQYSAMQSQGPPSR